MDTPNDGGLTSAPPSPIVGIAAIPNGSGYWIVDSQGSVYAFPSSAPWCGNAPSGSVIVGIAADPTADGYWLLGSNGAIYALAEGDCGNGVPYLGGANEFSPPPSGSIVGMTAMPNGSGYWLVASNGGVYNFPNQLVEPYGNSPFYGAAAYAPLPQPTVSIASTPDGGGYWLASADGSIIALATCSISAPCRESR